MLNKDYTGWFKNIKYFLKSSILRYQSEML